MYVWVFRRPRSLMPICFLLFLLPKPPNVSHLWSVKVLCWFSDFLNSRSVHTSVYCIHLYSYASCVRSSSIVFLNFFRPDSDDLAYIDVVPDPLVNPLSFNLWTCPENFKRLYLVVCQTCLFIGLRIQLLVPSFLRDITFLSGAYCLNHLIVYKNTTN